MQRAKKLITRKVFSKDVYNISYKFPDFGSLVIEIIVSLWSRIKCYLKLDSSNVCIFSDNKDMKAIQEQAEQAAKGMLEVAWDGIIPVDPIRIARKLGISVYEHKLDPEVSGAIVKEVGQDPVILLNSNDNVKRQTFTCAHEIGHFVYRADKANQEDVEHFEYVDFRAPLSSAGISEEEVFANSFAANLLMPGNLVREYAIHLLPSSLAVKFGVSIEAITYRLKNLNLLQ